VVGANTDQIRWRASINFGERFNVVLLVGATATLHAPNSRMRYVEHLCNLVLGVASVLSPFREERWAIGRPFLLTWSHTRLVAHRARKINDMTCTLCLTCMCIGCIYPLTTPLRRIPRPAHFERRYTMFKNICQPRRPFLSDKPP